MNDDMEYWERELLREAFEGSMTDEDLKKLKRAFGKIAGMLWLYYQAMKDVGFSDAFCLELVLSYQQVLHKKKQK